MVSWIKKQFNISVFLLSIAILSLFFSAYKARISEQNQTTRSAAFEMLKKLNHLQFIIDKEFYGKSKEERFLDGWADVVFIDDLSIFTSGTVEQRTVELLKTWKSSFEHLDNQAVNEKLSLKIKETKKALKIVIIDLN